MNEHIVDCDADPCLLKTYSIVRHDRDGKVRLELRNSDLYYNGHRVLIYKPRMWRSTIVAVVDPQKILSHLEKKCLKPLNANVCQYLREHQELIPEKWWNAANQLNIDFWGTIYLHSCGDPRCRHDGEQYVNKLFCQPKGNTERWGESFNTASSGNQSIVCTRFVAVYSIKQESRLVATLKNLFRSFRSAS